MRDVVVTGTGAISALGRCVDEMWDASIAETSGASALTQFDPDEYDLRSKVAFEVTADLGEHELVDQRNMGRHTQLAIIAIDEALADAGLSPKADAWFPNRTGVDVATVTGGLPEIQDGVKRIENGRRAAPRLATIALASMAAGQASITFDMRGPNLAPSTACAAGGHAIAEAAEIIRSGSADVMVAGGTDTPVTPICFSAFDSLRALSTRNDDPEGASRPFDANRDGLVLGEGAGVVVLESRDHAKARGADGYAELLGWARTSDAHHSIQPRPDAMGLTRALSESLSMANLKPDAVDHVNAHATATRKGDVHEVDALRNVFSADVPWVTGNKSQIGHTFGAAGGIESIFAVKSIEMDVIPPTINYETPDSECDVPVADSAIETDVSVVVNTSAGFGGTNSSLVFRSV